MPKLIKTISMSKSEQFRKKLFSFIIFFIAVSVGFYIYFINSVIMEIVARKNNISSLISLNFEYQQLEESYFSIISGFDEEYARSIGFVEQKDADFVSRPGAVAKR